jgi:hypothetical protein
MGKAGRACRRYFFLAPGSLSVRRGHGCVGRGRCAGHDRLSNGGPSHRGGRRRWRGGVYRFMTARAESKTGREREQSFLDLCHTLSSQGPA